MAEGQTATNPQTGERVVLRGGQWVPLGGGQSAPRQQRQAYTPQYNGPMPTSADALFPSLVAQESGGRAGVRGPMTQYGQALGRTQVLPSTARGIAQNLGVPYREDLLTGTTPEAAAYQDQLGRAYLEEGFAKTGNARDALMYYHGGPDRSLWGPKTQRYADEVLMRVAQGSGVAPVDNTPMPSEQSAIQTATNPQTGEKRQLIDGQWVPMDAPSQPPAMVPTNGVKDGVWVQATDGSDQWRYISREQADREANPEYQAALADARRGSENVPDQLRSFTQGSTLGFLDEILGGVNYAYQGLENAGNRVAGRENRYSASMAAQAARDSERDAQARFAASNPIQNFALQAAGGLVTPGLQAGGAYISGGTGAARLARAAQVGAGYGAVAGVGNSEGNLIQRAPDAVMGAGVGAATGAIGQGVVDRLTRGAVNPAAASQARRLSRAGVELTPGQMLANVPVVGPVARSLEEASSTIPFAGSPVSGARQRSVETFNRAAINRVLEPLEKVGLGQRIPTGVRAQIARIGKGDQNPESGYDAIKRVQDVVSTAYDRALDGVEVRPDTQFYDDLGKIVNDASERMTPQLSEQLLNALNNRAFRTLEFSDSPLTGQAFKRAESELGALAREQRVSLDPANRALAAALDDTRGALRDLVSRQRPDRAPQIQAVNRAYANLVPIEEASGSTVAEATEGVFTPTALAQAAKRSETRRTRATGEGRMQDLTSAGKGILNSRIGDSGTATRVGVTTLASGAAGAGTIVNPGVAVPVVVGVSALYSRPVQSLLNAAYRATDSRAANEAVQELARLAQRDPAILPYYEAAVQQLLGRDGTGTQATPPSTSSASAPSAALRRVMQ